MVRAAKKLYKITNWAKYNESLVQRGDITFWFSDETIRQWEHPNDGIKVGRPFVYSDTAIETMLALRELFRLPYRQTEGLGRALIQLMQVDVKIPDYTSLAKRAVKMNVSLDLEKHQGSIDIVVDSTGLKVYGEGEWKTRIHGRQKHRTWRKLHLAVDPETQEIVAELLLENTTHDSETVDDLTDSIDDDIDRFFGDGAYDTWDVYETLQERSVDAIIPPRKGAKIKQHGNSSKEPLARDVALRTIRRLGRKKWKEKIGYHIRSLAETAMHRFKNAFGDKLKNRLLAAQQTEAAIRTKILNHFTKLGLPEFTWS
ncbi:MAG: IS5 family transposase [Planctomycetia bacterium]|jgi:hypothetical protein